MHWDEVELADVLLQRFSSTIAPESVISHLAFASSGTEDLHGDLVAELLLDKGLCCGVNVESESASGLAIDRLETLMVAEPDFSSAADVFSVRLVGREE